MSPEISPDTIGQLTQLMAHEASLLDEGHFEAWLDLLEEDLQYTAPIRLDVVERGAAQPDSDGLALSFFRDSKATMQLRVAKLRTGLMQTENPPSRVVRVIGSVLVAPASPEGDHGVRSAFLIYRQHRQRDVDILAGHRVDRWRRRADGWGLAERRVMFAANVLPVGSLPLFY